MNMLDVIAPNRTRYSPTEPAYYDAIENEWRSGFADLPRQTWTGNDGKATRALLEAIDFGVKP